MSSAKGGGKKGGEKLQFKSPAEFFAENQNIAGFDNAGKALYTTIREFVENGLDAAESAGRLPEIALTVEEMDAKTFNRLRGASAMGVLTHGRGAARGAGGVAASTQPSTLSDLDASDGLSDGDEDDDDDYGAKPKKGSGKGRKKEGSGGGAGEEGGEGAAKAGTKGPDTTMYYRLTCRDNGCGLPHDRIPDFLGRVLAGSKYGVRQTRGKFGLGAKMALIWSKKSTGLPIEVTTSHGPLVAVAGDGNSSGGGGDASASTAASQSAWTPASSSSSSSASSSSSSAPAAVPGLRAPARVSYCRLDIDIYRNEPHVLEHTQRENKEGWVGTQITVCISGAWSAYRARVLHYFQQLAVITPYAQFTLNYANVSDGATGKADFAHVWKRRSTQVPRPPLEVKHHPQAVNDLLIQQLIDGAKDKASTSTLAGFLASQFQCISRELAVDIISRAGKELTPGTHISGLTSQHIHALRTAMDACVFKLPSGDCLSPAGEYNLRLGIMKELRPDVVATASSPVCVFQGHPFIVEAGVALGGRGSEGLTVHRFANRIPLLFEGGGDVATQTAMKRIAWASYKIDPVRDKVAVFVSLVSTKIPFKGTGKEYIGDDIPEIREAVKGVLQTCCTQLRVKLLRAAALRARANRRKALVKYIPDVTRALLGAFKSMATRRQAGRKMDDDDDDGGGASGSEGEGAAAAAAATRHGSSSFLGGGGAGTDTDDYNPSSLWDDEPASPEAVLKMPRRAASSGGAAAGVKRRAADPLTLIDTLLGAEDAGEGGSSSNSGGGVAPPPVPKRPRSAITLRPPHVLAGVAAGKITEPVLSGRLVQAVEKADLDAALDQAAAVAAGLLGGSGGGGGVEEGGGRKAPVFLQPVSQTVWGDAPELHHASCVIKLLPAVMPRKL